MRYIVFFLIGMAMQNCYSQPTTEIIDVRAGSRIFINKLYDFEPDTLYLYKWSLLNSQPDNILYILNTQTHTNDVGKKSPFLPFFVKRSEFDNKQKIFTLVYQDKIMIIKVIKNKPGLEIIINNMNFKEGIYNIDLQKIYDQYGEENITIEKFPTDEYLDLTRDKIVTLPQKNIQWNAP